MTAPLGFPLAGAPNSRDLGGLPVGNGRRIRRGVLLRSETLHALTPQDVEALAGARLVVDLRSRAERDRAPSRLPAAGVPHVLVAHDAAEAADADPERSLLAIDADVERTITRYMHDMYGFFVTGLESTVREVGARILEGDVPVLIHCTAGKDRTGFLSMVLLLALGASREVVAADYLRSDVAFGRERIAEAFAARTGRPPDPALVEGFRVRRAYLDSAFAAMEERHGSVEAYLEAVGLGAAARPHLDAVLTEPAD